MNNVWINIELKTKDIQIETISYSVEGTYDEEKGTLTYQEQAPNEEMEASTSTFTLLDQGLKMVRENDEMLMECIFTQDENTFGKYVVKEFDVNFPLNIFTDQLYVDMIGGKIHVRYYLEMNNENEGLYELTIDFN